MNINLFKGIIECIENMTTSFKIGYNEAKTAGMVPLLAGYIPKDAKDQPRLVVILDTVGGEVDGQLPDQVRKSVQVLARAETYFTALADSLEIFTAIHGMCCDPFPAIESGIEYKNMTIDALSDPGYIGQDENGYFQFSTNYIWIIKDAV
jgi:hypothetical protein